MSISASNVIEQAELERLVVDDRENGLFRVHRRSLTSPEILELERTRIFERCWLYLGHESEVPEAGDFRTRTINGRPLIFIRQNDGQIAAIYNSCTHRGARICREAAGSAEVLQCPYHFWTYDTTGSLIGVPGADAYPPDFDRAERSLRHAPRVDSFRGFVFVSFNPDQENLTEYLAGAADYLALVADQSVMGMKVVPGANKYACRANWKLMIENSIDGYHGLPVHSTYFDYVSSIGSMHSKRLVAGRGHDLGNGHAVIESEAPMGRPVARWDVLFGEDAKDDIAAIRADIVNRFGEERAWRMCDTLRNLLIFPNLIVNDVAAITVRTMEPLAPDYMNVNAWALARGEENAEQVRRRLDSYLTFLGPGGFATPDDIEVLEEAQRGFATIDALEYSDISRGMGRTEPVMNDELQMRSFWRTWRARILGEPVPVRVTEVESPGLQSVTEARDVA